MIGLPIQAAIAVVIFVAGMATGVKWQLGVHARAEVQRLEQVRIQATAHRATERSQATQVQEATNEARKREILARAAADGAQSELGRLRDSLTAIRTELPKSSACPGNERADTAIKLFGECAAALTDLGATADRIDSDRRTLADGWPRVNP